MFINRARYPALRLRPSTQRTPALALKQYGFSGAEIDAHSRDWRRSYGAILPQLVERARAVAGEEAAGRLQAPSDYSRHARELLYLAVRLARPEVVVETGTFSGTSATAILLAVRDNGVGRLVSLDLPAYEPIPNATDVALPEGMKPGWLVPDELRPNLEIVLGDARRTLVPTLDRLGRLDLFVHDSLHTTRHMLFEYREAWKRLPAGGLLVTDDAFMTPAFWWFTRRNGVSFRHVGAMAVTRKPLAV